jgi:epoxyqueuosine reductase
LAQDEQHLLNWLEAGYHGEMDYMQRHGTKRSRPRELVPGTLRVVSVQMNYWPARARDAREVLSAEPPPPVAGGGQGGGEHSRCYLPVTGFL